MPPALRTIQPNIAITRCVIAFLLSIMTTVDNTESVVSRSVPALNAVHEPIREPGGVAACLVGPCMEGDRRRHTRPGSGMASATPIALSIGPLLFTMHHHGPSAKAIVWGHN